MKFHNHKKKISTKIINFIIVNIYDQTDMF